jgi:hypothetical protein
MANPVKGDSTDPSIAGVTGTNSGNAAGATGVFGEGAIGVTGFGALVGILGEGPPTPNFVAVKGDGGGIPIPEGPPTFGVIGTTRSLSGIAVQGVNQSGGVAGDFQGNVNVNGGMTVTGRINVLGETGMGILAHGPTAGRFEGNVEVTGNINGQATTTITCFDVKLIGADCAEEFDLADEGEGVSPGTVLVIDTEGALRLSREAYDRKVAGVVSGAGEYKPGILLNKQNSPGTRVPLTLVGRTYCKVDAGYSPVEVGDLLTTSPTPGHAMKASDPLKAFGAVIGKALCAVKEGRGLVPILVALQ